MYRKRAEYIGNVGYPFVHIQSVSSSNVRTSFDLLVDAYCSTKIFVNLPGLSRLLVRKITEVMACGTFPLTSSSRSSSAYRNMEPSEHRKHIVYYDPDDPGEIGRQVTYYLANPAERDAIAAAGRAEVIKKSRDASAAAKYTG